MAARLSTWKSHVRAAVTGCVLGVVGCAAEPADPFVPQYETARLRIGLTFDAELCVGHQDMWEAHLDILEQTFGVTRDFAWLLVYQDEEELQIAEDCGWDSGISSQGCWRDPLARSILEKPPHELVHGWFSSRQPHALPALREGIAVCLAGAVQYVDTRDLSAADVVRVESKAGYPDFPFELYPKPAHFVAWLLATYGVDAFMVIYTHTSRGMTEAEASAVFQDVLGISLEDALSTYAKTAKDYYPAMGGAACGQGPVIPWQGDAATWPAEGSCADGPLFGYEAGSHFQRVTVELASAGTYRLEVGGRDAALLHCLTTPLDEAELPELRADGVSGDWLFSTPQQFWGSLYDDWDDRPPLELTAGTYEVWVDRTHDIPDSLGFNPNMRLRKL
jgi:hypothetical protein